MTQTLTINGVDSFGTWGTDDLRSLGSIPKEFPVTTVSGIRTFAHGLEKYDINARYKITYDVVPYGSVRHGLNLYGTDSISYVAITPATITYTIDEAGAGTGLTITSANPYHVEMEFNIPAEQKSGSSAKLMEFRIANGNGYAIENLKIIALNSNWTLHQNARVMDDETLLLNATATTQESFYTLTVKPSTTYSITWDTIGQQYGVNQFSSTNGKSGYISGIYVTTNTYTFTTTSSTNSISIYPSNTSAGIYTFKKPMLTMEKYPLYVPVVITGDDGVSRPLRNILGLNGNMQSANQLSASSSTITVDSSKSTVGNSSLQILSNDSTISYKEVSKSVSGSIVDQSKYYLFLADMFNIDWDQASFMVGITSPSPGNKGKSFTRTEKGQWITIYNALSPSELSGVTNIQIKPYCYMSNSAPGNGHTYNVDGFRVYEIDKSTYDKINVDPSFTGENLGEKFPYVDGVPYYEKKKGNLMIPTIFNNGSYSLVNTPQRYVAKKNLIPGNQNQWEQGTLGNNSGSTTTLRIRTINFFSAKPNTNYTISWSNSSIYDTNIMEYNTTNLISQTHDSGWLASSPYTIKTQPGTNFIRIVCRLKNDAAILYSDIINIMPQLEEGSTATAYESYVPLLPSTNKGLVLNGTSTYIENRLNMGTITNNNIAVEMLVNLNRAAIPGQSPCLLTEIYAGTTLQFSIYFSGNQLNVGFFSGGQWHQAVDPSSFPLNQWIKIYATYDGVSLNVYYNDVLHMNIVLNLPLPVGNGNGWRIGRRWDQNGYVDLISGTIAYVKAWSNNVLTMNYDFRNPSTYSGNIAFSQIEKGRVFNGTSDFLQLPSMQMDAVELDILIDLNQPTNASGYNNILDTRTGLANGYVSLYNGSLYGGSSLTLEGFKTGERTILTAKSLVPFTDGITIFAGNMGVDLSKGTLYRVRCYLNGQVVYEQSLKYTSLQNLVPSFTSGKWTIHPNAKVLGSDILHVDATAGSQVSYVDIPIAISGTYKVFFQNITINGYTKISYLDANKNDLGSSQWFGSTANGSSLAIPSNTAFIRYQLYGNNAGSFDFIKPQLYIVDGTEGTIYGNITPLQRPATRNLIPIR